jgi:hypothetical protein
MFGKKKKERKKLIAEYKALFEKQLEKYREEAEKSGRTLRQVFEDNHEVSQTRATTNVIMTRHTGGSSEEQKTEIESIHKEENQAEDLFRVALDEFLKEIGEKS